jgi:type II restriction/modification system DNA methylase subunit YeeA
MGDRTMINLCECKTPKEVLSLRIADIACGSGDFLDEVFLYLQNYCLGWYLTNEPSHLIEIGNGLYKLPLQEKKQLLCSCIYGIELDIHAVTVAKFTLLLRLIENETSPSVKDTIPILPDLSNNIFHGNALIETDDIKDIEISTVERIQIKPFSWSEINRGNAFDAIIGNPPYVSTEEMHTLLCETEFELYVKKYESAYKQFDKYFLFIERALNGLSQIGFLSYIVPNKYYKVGAGEKLRGLISSRKALVAIDDFGANQLFNEKTIYSSVSLFQNSEQKTFEYSHIESCEALWAGENINKTVIEESTLSSDPWQLTDDHEILTLLSTLNATAVPFENVANVFNGIQTSAERPVPVYWFDESDVEFEDELAILVNRDGHHYKIEKSILKPYFKPTKKSEKGLNSYSIMQTAKRIIFPYDGEGKLYSIDIMKRDFLGTYAYLEQYYNRLLPKSVSPGGKRDVPGATADTWYQYGRTQALTSFINTPKLIVGILSKDPMYAYDGNDMLIASGGTAGYCAISAKADSNYEIEYLQAWLASPYTERIIAGTASDFEGGFIARGTYLLSQLPFAPLDFGDVRQKKLYTDVVTKSKRIYTINERLDSNISRNDRSVLEREKTELIKLIQNQIEKVYLDQWD